ncbi:hypothetical protein K457DRAFT_374963 [Linnemannia elongata AG-77]|uniref:Uncharacterized protein n=1 Tax=Linnemannia elongata AG-77 TaxID=1314771 RepID=A0A197KF42_9FUNG|nr:hypothetical protein K457DRAFT_374963 [Linnemannia elongata AG-77]
MRYVSANATHLPSFAIPFSPYSLLLFCPSIPADFLYLLVLLPLLSWSSSCPKEIEKKSFEDVLGNLY